MTRLAYTALSAIAILVISTHTHATTLYFEGFDDPATLQTGTGSLVSVYGWEGHQGSNGAISSNWASSPLNAGQGSQLRVVADAGAPTPPNRVFAFFSPSNDVLAWTEAFAPINLSDYTDLAIGWEHSNAGGAMRAAIRIDDGGTDRWFASDLFTTSPNVWTAAIATLDATNWFEFNFDGTQTTSASGAFDVTGPSTALPTAGSITGAGLYLELPNQTSMRFDSFQITGNPVPADNGDAVIPEPVSAMLALTGLTALALRRRRMA